MKIHKLVFLLAVIGVAACDSEGVIRPPQTTVQIFNASPEFSSLVFIRVRRSESTLPYGEASTHRFDSGEYEFTIGSSRLGFSSTPAEHVFTDTVSADFDHTFVMVSDDEVVDSLLISKPLSAAPEDNARITIVHAHPGLDQVDAYLESSGTDLSSVMPRGTLQYGSDAQFSFAPGTARIYLTPPGDPGTVLYESGSLNLAAENDPSLIISDSGDRGFAEINVFVVDGGASQRINQANLESSVRILNGITDRMDRDVLLNGDTTTPLFNDLQFGVLSADTLIPQGVNEFIITPVDAPGTEESTVLAAGAAGIYTIGIAAGDSTDGINLLIIPEDRQGIVGQSKLSIINSAGLFNDMLVYVASPGTDISTINPLVSLPAPSAQLGVSLLPGEYEITFVETDTQAVRGEPETYTFEDKGVYGFYLVNGADSTTVDVFPMYEIAP